MTPLERLKIRLEIDLSDTGPDEQLSLRLSDAEDFFRAYCHRPDIPPSAGSLIERLAAFDYANRANVKSETVADMGVSYYEGLPLRLKREINRFRRIRAI